MLLLWNISLLIVVMTSTMMIKMLMTKMMMTNMMMTMPGDNKVLRAWGVRRQMMESVTGRWAAPL